MGASAVLLLAFMFLVPWYGLSAAAARADVAGGVSTSVDGWHALTVLRWLMLVSILVGLALVFLQATRRAPALPAILSVIVSFLGPLTALSLFYRVLINLPGPDGLVEQKIGAFLGLLSACALSYGGYVSLREEESIPSKDALSHVETVSLGPSAPGT